MINLLISLSLESSYLNAEGGLFDFNATLPLMAIQILCIMVILNTVFYKPIAKVLNDRDKYVRSSLELASKNLQKSEELTQLYETNLMKARQEAQLIISISKKEAQDKVAQEIQEAQSKIAVVVMDTSRQLNQQQEQALKQLETQVEVELIRYKLLSI
uniref:ATP synthase subunit b', chloroplastic n=1 Tax=Corynoplastis japonica TaxID=700918 RepID=A0A1X9PTT8_9RHOD|nr:ATP synthase CF0 subunit B' [Corynoplastis japonica]